ncbi:MAG: DUF2063 domain-containing protein [Alphaproteobacteria bacterium]|nr:DUF2063 domain-containing protein [Alphaproteobacteria bacterium]
MRPLAERQGAFAGGLLDAARPIPSGLFGPDGQASLKRFSVYRNNVVVSLIEALEAAYPATVRLVGEEFFRAMARAYAVAHPPTSPIMLGYGDGFADFIAGFAPARDLPYLADVARIERAWLEAYHAPDAMPLTADTLAPVAQDVAGSLVFQMHPSLRIVRSRYPALTIWRMNVTDGEPVSVDLERGGEDVLIVRPDVEVEVRSLPPGGLEFVRTLAAGHCLEQATEHAIPIEGFDLAANLAGLLGAGAFIGFVNSRTRG